MKMNSKYDIFCKVIEMESFTKAADCLKYSQSAVSQMVKSLEQECGTILVNRKKDGVTLTQDGEQYFPYIQEIANAEAALEQKKQEMMGLKNSTIRIGTFTSVSRNILPGLMKQFKEQFPAVNFVLSQGEYTSIEKWIKEGSIDFGFINANAVSGIELSVLYQDEMMAVLPQTHPLVQKEQVTLKDLAKEPFILLDEGEYSLPMEAFAKAGLMPDIEYKVYDDYSILAMVRKGLGVAMMYRMVVQGFEEGLSVKPIVDKTERKVAIGWKNWETMPLAAKRFIEYLLRQNSICELVENE